MCVAGAGAVVLAGKRDAQFFLLKERSKTPPPKTEEKTEDEFCLCMALERIWFMICFSFSAP